MKYKIGTFVKATTSMAYYNEGEVGLIIDVEEDPDPKMILYTICFFDSFVKRHNANGLTEAGHGYFARERMIDNYFTTEFTPIELSIMHHQFVDALRPGDRIQTIYDEDFWGAGTKGTVIEKFPGAIAIRLDEDGDNYTFIHSLPNRIVPVIKENYNSGRRLFYGVMPIVTDWTIDSSIKKIEAFIDSNEECCVAERAEKGCVIYSGKYTYTSIFDCTKEALRTHFYRTK